MSVFLNLATVCLKLSVILPVALPLSELWHVFKLKDLTLSIGEFLPTVIVGTYAAGKAWQGRGCQKFVRA